MPLRPLPDRSTAYASSTSPARTGRRKEMSAPAATVTGPWLLQAHAKAVSASRKTYPPCAIACPLTIAAVTVIRTLARPPPASSSSMPRPREAGARSNISCAAVRANLHPQGLITDRTIGKYLTSQPHRSADDNPHRVVRDASRAARPGDRGGRRTGLLVGLPRVAQQVRVRRGRRPGR